MAGGGGGGGEGGKGGEKEGTGGRRLGHGQASRHQLSLVATCQWAQTRDLNSPSQPGYWADGRKGGGDPGGWGGGGLGNGERREGHGQGGRHKLPLVATCGWAQTRDL